MAGLKKSPKIATSSEAAILRQCSKAALIDIVVVVLARANGHCDEACTPTEIMDEIEPTLLLRGDRLPKMRAG